MNTKSRKHIQLPAASAINSLVQSASAASPRELNPGAVEESGPERNSAAQSPERANAATSGAKTWTNVVFKMLDTLHMHNKGSTWNWHVKYIIQAIMRMCTSLWSLSVGLLVNLLHFLQQLTHVKRVRGSWRRMKELIHQLQSIYWHKCKRSYKHKLFCTNENEAQINPNISPHLFFGCNFYSSGRNLGNKTIMEDRMQMVIFMVRLNYKDFVGLLLLLFYLAD